jgi:hypothetical protein
MRAGRVCLSSACVSLAFRTIPASLFFPGDRRAARARGLNPMCSDSVQSAEASNDRRDAGATLFAAMNACLRFQVTQIGASCRHLHKLVVW